MLRITHIRTTLHNHPAKPGAAFTNAPAPAKTSHIQGAHGAPSAQRSTRNNRSIQAQVNNLPPATVKHSKKKPEGCAEGPRLCGPFAVFLQSFKKTTTSCRFLQYPLSSVHADLPLCRHPQVPYPPSYQPPQNMHPV